MAAPGARAAGGESCADAPVIGALPFTDTGATTCGFNDTVNNMGAGACADLPVAYPGPDVFYKLSLGAGNAVAFDLTMPLGATGDLALFLLAVPTCGAAGQCAAYSVDVRGAGQGPERIKAASYAAGTYYVVVDSVNAAGAMGSCGAYSLSVSGSLGDVSVPDAGSDAASDANAGGVDASNADAGADVADVTDAVAVTDAADAESAMDVASDTSLSDTSGALDGDGGVEDASVADGSSTNDAASVRDGGATDVVGAPGDASTDKPKTGGGGSGCSCSVAAGSSASGTSAWQLGLAFVALILCRRRR